ncbi:MAG: hypothetical protein N3E41_08865, partial [Thermofilaceae archaeon]|nr:hypothetical protein [Thermofilaceae archaeon]
MESKAAYVLGEAGEEGVRALFSAGAGREFSATVKAAKIQGILDIDEALKTMTGGSVPPGTGGFSLGGGVLKQGLQTVAGYKVTVPVTTVVKPATETVEKAAKAAAAVASVTIAQPKTLEAVTVPVKTGEKTAKPVLQVLVKEEKVKELPPLMRQLTLPLATPFKVEPRARELKMPPLPNIQVPQLFEPLQVQKTLQAPRLSTIQVTATDYPNSNWERIERYQDARNNPLSFYSNWER